MKKRNFSQSSMFFSRGSKKRGSEKYYIIISLILGLIVLSLSLYFIFHEYFTKDELDWQMCRQSIYLRSISPNFKDITDLKDALPLKCKTEVVTIDTAEPKIVYGKISDTVAAGWYLFGEGEYDIVPREVLKLRNTNYCMVFARVHYTEKAIEEYGDIYRTGSEEGFKNYYVSTKLKNSEQTYHSYLPLIYSREDLVYNYLTYNPALIKFYPDEQDLFFVYIVTKFPGRLNIIFPVSIDINKFRLISTEEEEKYKFVVITNLGNLNKIGCDEFIAIPA